MARVAGAIVLILVVLPAHRLLDHAGTGLAGSSAVATIEGYRSVMWAGLLIAALLGAVGYILPWDIAAATRRTARRMTAVPIRTYAAALAAVAFAVTLAFSLVVLDGWPSHVDAVAQFLHARFVAAGMVSAPAQFSDFWIVQNTLNSGGQWLSQYPPGHVALLSIFMRAGAEVLMGPLLAAAIAALAVVLADQLWPDDPRTARVAGLLAGISPFMLLLAGSFMNHITALAFIMGGACALARARTGAHMPAVLAGVLFSGALLIRPVAALAAAFAFAVALPATTAGLRPWSARWLRMLGLASLGALPGVLLQLAYNARYFGGPTTFGYDAALGPATGLGFGKDPWGNMYGLQEALGWISAEFVMLGAHLLEAPISAMLVIGAYLLLARRTDAGTRVVLTWAALSVAAGALYWHHGFYMGPRMMSDAAPAWAMLFAASAIGLVRLLGTPAPSTPASRARNALAFMLAGSTAAGLLLFAPQRADSYRVERVDVTAENVPPGSLVFVHGSWSARIVARLAASGMRADRIETLMRQNATCAVHQLSLLIAAGDSTAARALMARLDTVPGAAALPSVEIGPGSEIRGTDAPGDPGCLQEVRSDRFGVIDPGAMVWRGRIPLAADPRGVIFVRDMGPARNADFAAEHPGRTPMMLGRDASGAVRVTGYAEAAASVWQP